MREREQERLAGLAIPRHVAFEGRARTLALAGTHICAGQGLALLRDGEDIVVMPVDAATLVQLQRKPAGSSVTVSARGVTRSKARAR